MRKPIAVLAIAVALATPAVAQTRDLAPLNECSRVEGADSFRMALATAVANRNETMLLPLFAEDVLLDFGGGSGRETLSQRLDDPEYRLWQELDEMLRLGCAKGAEGGIVMPWLWVQELGEDDAFAVLYVTGSDVPVYRDATGDDIIARVSWGLVGWPAYLEQSADEVGQRTKIIVPGKRTGFIANDKVRSLVDYRLIVDRMDDGQLQVTAFVAGD